MKVWMLTILDTDYYSLPDIEDVEEFPSLRAARDDFWRTCEYERIGDVLDHTAHIFFYDPREARDPYPDRVLTLGPRGGVRMEVIR